MANEKHDFIEGVRLKTEPAPVMKRILALAIDLGIVSVAGYGVIVVVFLVGLTFAIPFAKVLKDLEQGQKAVLVGGALVLFLVLILIMMCLTHVYFIYYETKNGATPGKRLMGLRVVALNGGPITRGQAVYRDFVRWYLDLLFILPALISMYVTKNRQRVGDLLADTLVVHSMVAEERDQFLYVKREDYISIYEYLQPEPVPRKLREDYLRFAGQAFLMKDLANMAQEHHWLNLARGHLLRTEELGLNDFTVLRFFAELCFQEDLKEKQLQE